MNSRELVLSLSLGIAVFCATAGVRAEQYQDALLTTPGTPKNIEKGLEPDAYQLGISAYVWGYAAVRMERVVREYTDVREKQSRTSYRAPLNQLGWARELATPAAKDMPSANNDTAYLSAVVDLTEPYVLSVPDVADRYYVVNAFNMWQELQHYIGRRTTGTKAGRFAYVPPGWKGALPAGIVRLDMTTSKVWLWGRLRVAVTDTPEMVRAIQDKFDLRPLSALPSSNWQPRRASLPPMPELGTDELGFFRHLAFAVQANPVRKTDEALFGRFERIGLTEKGFDPSNLTPSQKKGLERAMQDAPYVVIASTASTAEMRNGWIYARGLDDFGYNYALRSLVAGPYLGGQGEQEAVYPVRYSDETGQPLTGKKKYVVRFPSPPPNEAFWSLTIYDAKSKMLVANEIERYKVGTDTPGLKTRGDGSFEIPISHTKATGEFNENWLPAPTGDFYLILRIYQPKKAVIANEWELPQVERAAP
jgi:hypothetical protein